MAKYKPEDVRNFALVGSGGSGKTSVAEAILYTTGATSRMGRVDEGNTKTDYDPDEVARKITINSMPLFVEWKGTELNVVDTPGFADFFPEVEQVLNVLDGIVLVVDAQSGVAAQTERAWNMARDRGLPVVVFVNKLDKENADQEKVVERLRQDLGGNFVSFAVPVGTSANVSASVGLIARKCWAVDDKGKVVETDVPAAMAGVADERRGSLVEAAADADDAIAEKFLAEEPISDEEVRAALRKGVATGKVCPVVGGVAVKAVGIPALLEMCVNYLPPPTVRPVKAKGKDGAEVEIDPKGSDFCAQVFKVLSEQHLGEIALVRIFSGSCKTADVVFNSVSGEREKLASIQRLRGKDRSDSTDPLVAGQIAGLVKLKTTKCGHTLCSEAKPVVRDVVPFPDPLMAVAIRTKEKADSEKLANAISRIGTEDPLLRVRMDATTHETLLEGQGDTQFDIFLKRLKEKYKVEVDVSKPKIAYLETIRKKGEGQGKHKKQTGGRGQFGDVHIRFEPLPAGSGFEFEDITVGGCVPNKFIPAVKKGLDEIVQTGVLAGFPTTDLRASLFFGSSHPVDSSEIAFKQAAHKCFKKVMPTCNPVLLEPIMEVEILVPESFMGDIMGDLNTRRGKILGMEPVGRKQRIRANVPLAEMYRYIIQLRSMTEGRGEYRMKPSHYEEVPHAIAEGIVSQYKREDVEEDD